MWKRFHCRESEIQTDKISPKNGGNMPRSWITPQAELYVRCSFTVAFRNVSAMSGAPEAAPGTPSAGCYCMTGHATSTASVHTFWQMGLSENRVYSQWNSHLIGIIGIMISKTIGFRGTQHFQTHPYLLSTGCLFQASFILVMPWRPTLGIFIRRQQVWGFDVPSVPLSHPSQSVNRESS
jgi:hypothetical protein